MQDTGPAAELSAWVENRPMWSPSAPVILPEHDEQSDEATDSLGYAEGQSFMIEYVDSTGKESRRRITVWSIEMAKGTQIPSLYAKCHERNAMRQFRIDRIRCCIDHDGEIHDDVPRYLSDCFGMSVALAKRNKPVADERWNDILAAVRFDAVLLAALSRCDGNMRPVEIEEIVVHLAKIAETGGSILSDQEIADLGRHVKRLRPTAAAIARALAAADSMPPARIKGTLLAAARVMDADGVRHPAEVRLLRILSRELLGLEIL